MSSQTRFKFENISRFLTKFCEKLPNLFSALVMLSSIMTYLSTRSGSNLLNILAMSGSAVAKLVLEFWIMSCRCSILWPNSISFLLSDSFFRYSIFSMIFWNRGTIQSVASTIMVASFMDSFFWIFPKAFMTSYRKFIVGNSSRKCRVLLNIFLVAQLSKALISLNKFTQTLTYFSTSTWLGFRCTDLFSLFLLASRWLGWSMVMLRGFFLQRMYCRQLVSCFSLLRN